jgi:hypothetical protein
MDVMQTAVGHWAGAEVTIMLNAFENELDALLSLMDEERNPARSEAVIRRYTTAEEIHDDLLEQTKRITLKMEMAGNRLAGDIGD